MSDFEVHETAPDTIYLNLGFSDAVAVFADFDDLSEVTWSEDKIGQTDIKYVKKEKLDTAIEVLRDCEKALEQMDEDVLGYNKTPHGKYPFKEELHSKVIDKLSELDCEVE